MNTEPPKFALTRIVVTPGAIALATEQGVDLTGLLYRHSRGDFGRVCDEDREANERAMINGGRILSVYPNPMGELWILTEHDRSYTTVLLPSEY